MNCSYKLSESETTKAMQLHGRGAKSTLIAFCVSGLILGLVGIFTKFTIIVFCAIIGGVLGYFAVIFALIPFNARKQYKENRALRNEITLELTDHGISFRSDSGESKLKWSDIHKWKHANKIFLLYITSNMFHMVPSRALTDEGQLINLLSKNVGAKKA